MTYKTGQLIVLTHGEYDDYQIECLMRASKDFDLREQVTAFRAKYAMVGDEEIADDIDGQERNVNQLFAQFLVEQGAALIIEHEELCFSTYGKIVKAHYCRHERRSFHLFTGLHPDHDAVLGSMAETCDDCRMQFLEETARPATLEEYLAIYPHMRNPANGLRYTDEEYRAAHPEFWPAKAAS